MTRGGGVHNNILLQCFILRKYHIHDIATRLLMKEDELGHIETRRTDTVGCEKDTSSMIFAIFKISNTLSVVLASIPFAAPNPDFQSLDSFQSGNINLEDYLTLTLIYDPSTIIFMMSYYEQKE